MKKEFQKPEMQEVELEDVDVICTSGCAVPCRTYGTESATEPLS